MKKNSTLMLLLLICFLPVTAFCQSNNEPVVAGSGIAVTSTESGKVKGYLHNGIFTFKGIPYAKADRFMAPKNLRHGQMYAVQKLTVRYVLPIQPQLLTTNLNLPFSMIWVIQMNTASRSMYGHRN
ncbi:hypothetical protein ACFJIV_15415 [Mucilaginibacter sp. UC70_90]